MGALLKDKEISEAVWRAAIATPISTHAINRMQRFPDELGKLGITVEIPVWWTNALKAIQKKLPQNETADAEIQ